MEKIQFRQIIQDARQLYGIKMIDNHELSFLFIDFQLNPFPFSLFFILFLTRTTYISSRLL